MCQLCITIKMLLQSNWFVKALQLINSSQLQKNYWQKKTNTRLTALSPGPPRWAGTRKAKPIWILLKQETVSGSGISWNICKSAPRSRQITMPEPNRSVFLQAGCPSCRPNNSVKALKEFYQFIQLSRNMPCIKVWHVASDEVCMKTGPKTLKIYWLHEFWTDSMDSSDCLSILLPSISVFTFLSSCSLLSGGLLAKLFVWSECRVSYGPADATATHCLLLQ